MRRPLFAILFGLLGLFWLTLPTAAAAASDAASTAERGALFRVSLGTHVMHLFGTLHVGLPEFYPLEPRITEAIAESSTLALELDPDQPRSTMLGALRDYGMLAPDASAASGYAALTPEQNHRLDRLIRQGGLDAGTALQYKPVLLAIMLTLSEYTRQGYRPDWASEYVLARLARRDGVRVVGLESLGGQLAILDRLAPPERLAFLQEMMGTIESGAQQVEARAMVRAWSHADQHALDAIAANCEADQSVSGRFANAVLLKERNAALADKLTALLANENRTVAAIGVLHLLGTGSVPALLKARGIVVERIY